MIEEVRPEEAELAFAEVIPIGFDLGFPVRTAT
jgi:hypothetical protein